MLPPAPDCALQVAAGKTDRAVLQREEKVLNKMQNRLAGLQEDFQDTADQASGLLGLFGLAPKKQAPPMPEGMQQGLAER